MKSERKAFDDAHGTVNLSVSEGMEEGPIGTEITIGQDRDVVMLSYETLYRIAASLGIADPPPMIDPPALRTRIVAKSRDGVAVPLAGHVIEYHQVYKVDYPSFEKLRVETREGLRAAFYRTDPESSAWKMEGTRYDLFEA